MQVVILFVMLGALYAFMIVPQQRKMKAHQALLRSLEEGDLVVTSSGIFGAIAEVEDDVVWLEVAPEVELKIMKSSVTEKVADFDTDDDDENDVDDETDDEFIEIEDES
ncbi:MAG: preprotein translocase subunit YajC [Acidimicrobiaceae bacterium]|jgi:preprotein translocase subunit YajC|nr:preprotein translocase subunit YajC [Acidimicrobiaceae bacterium]MBT5581770.1 preprotein translocase subunit YajC [Acidimicrobiaceae bacterium]MBT5849214.1 preprotein translocase subunit YajC [Acidimicrobiaceae bacterium]